MIDIKRINTELDLIKQSTLSQKVTVDFDKLIDLDTQRKEIIYTLDDSKKKRNDNSSLIAKGKLDQEEKEKLIQETRELGDIIKKGDTKLKEIMEAIRSISLSIPNVIDASTPIGDSEDQNPEISRWGTPKKLDFAPKHHADLAEELDILDPQRGVKIAHSRFTLVKNAAARLERALMNFMLDLHTSEHGYQEILPPFLVNADCLVGTGQLPKFEEDLFKTTEGLYLIPTAEVPLTNIHKDELLKEEDLPLNYTSYTPCFRSEAGSYGKDTKGYIRQHQFNKVEMVKIVHPDTSYDELEKLLNNATEVLKRLELPYRIIQLCSGDIGFSAAKCYDIEVWVPSENRYREISSCSNCTDFQARRANIRYKPKGGGKSQFVHTLNGSGLAIGRTLVAILENYQTAEGTVLIPEVLQPYMRGLTKIEPRS